MEFDQDLYVRALTAMMVVISAVGIYGWFKGVPFAVEERFNQLLAQAAVEPYNMAVSWIMYWAFVSVVVGVFLAYGYFWDQPLWPEKAVMIPATGFTAVTFVYSILKVLGVAGVASVLNTMNFYLALGVVALVGLTGRMRGES